MRRIHLLYLLLALLGFEIGALLDRPAPILELDFGQGCERAAVSPDGRWVAGLLKAPQGWVVGIADMHGDSAITPIPVPDPPARAQTFAWHSSSRWLAFGCQDGVRLFDTKKGSHKSLATNPAVKQVIFRGDLLLARSDGTVTIWNVKTGKRTALLRIPYLLQADLSKDGKTLVVGCFGEGIRIIALPSGKVTQHLSNGLTPIAAALCNGDRWLATGLRSGNPTEDQARLFDVSSGRQLGPTLAHPHLRGLAVSSDGSRMLLRSDSQVDVWEPSTGRKLASRDIPSRLIDALSPDGQLIATTAPDTGEVTVWSPDSETMKKQLTHPAMPVQVSFATDNRLEVVGDRYRLWWIR